MPVPTPSNVIRVRLIHSYGTDTTAGSRFFMKYTDASAPSIADLNTMATFVRTTWSAQLAGMMSTGNSLVGVQLQDLASSSGNQGNDTTAVAGTRAGAGLPQEVTAVMNFKVAQQYRGGKFKAYLPYGSVSDQASGRVWSNTFTAALVTAWNAFITALNGHTAGALTFNEQQAVSYFKGPRTNTNASIWARRNIPAPRATPVVYDVISVSVNPIFSVQKKRRLT